MNSNQQRKPIRQEYNSIKITILELLNIEFGKVRQVTVNGIVYYLAHDVCSVLELTNTTNVIKGLSDATTQNSPMKTNIKKHIDKINPYRKVYLISLEGVFEIVLKHKSRKCLELKEYFSKMVLPKCAGIMGARSVNNDSICSENGAFTWE